MIHALFYILSRLPRVFIILLIDIYMYARIYKLFASYKITKINLKIAYPDLNNSNIELISKLSIRESLVSGYETIFTWGSNTHDSNQMIFRIENNFLLNNYVSQGKGLISVAIHNRSVDMLLAWICSQTPTVSLYKKIKIKSLDSFVKNKRESDGSSCVETSITGVRKIYKALKANKVICFAADQVPQRGMGEYIKLFNRDAYSTTLVQSLAIKTRCPLVYFYINSNKGNFLTVTIKNINNNIYSDSKHSQIVNKGIEKIINARPIDYSWEYKRFKKSKTEQQDPYLGV
jgi:KDO2-lipid IV(A) lauroyltransferase